MFIDVFIIIDFGFHSDIAVICFKLCTESFIECPFTWFDISICAELIQEFINFFCYFFFGLTIEIFLFYFSVSRGQCDLPLPSYLLILIDASLVVTFFSYKSSLYINVTETFYFGNSHHAYKLYRYE